MGRSVAAPIAAATNGAKSVRVYFIMSHFSLRLCPGKQHSKYSDPALEMKFIYSIRQLRFVCTKSLKFIILVDDLSIKQRSFRSSHSFRVTLVNSVTLVPDADSTIKCTACIFEDFAGSSVVMLLS